MLYFLALSRTKRRRKGKYYAFDTLLVRHDFMKHIHIHDGSRTTAKRAEIDRRVDEKVAADRRKIMVR